MSDTIRRNSDNEKTVVVNKDDIEQQIHKSEEEKTVLDTVNEGREKGRRRGAADDRYSDKQRGASGIGDCRRRTFSGG